jgi:hypothetical protein
VYVNVGGGGDGADRGCKAVVIANDAAAIADAIKYLVKIIV